MYVVCLDLEGVLVPEIWIAFSEATGIDGLRLTTRDVPDYNRLMQGRLKLLKENGLTLPNIQDVIRGIDPLEGASEFLESLRSAYQVIILSDTFTEFAQPLMKKLGWPTLFCNNLVVDSSGSIVDYKLRQQEGKKRAVEAIKSVGYSVLAAGDSYNDLTMIDVADAGILFRPPANIVAERPDLSVVADYSAFRSAIDELTSR